MTEPVAPIAWPGVLAEIAAIAGDGAAMRMVATKGGIDIYVPHKLDKGHWLIDVAGSLKAARAICKAMGGGTFVVPLSVFGSRAKTWRIIAQARREGKSAAEAARLAGVHLSTAKRHGTATERKGKDDRQGDLF